MDIYANPELYEMFNLYLGVTNGSRHENMRESQAMAFLMSFDDSESSILDSSGSWTFGEDEAELWQILEEVYGDSPSFQWWTYNGRQTGIGGFDDDEPWTIELLYDLTQKIVTNLGWEVPLGITAESRSIGVLEGRMPTQVPTELIQRNETFTDPGNSDQSYVRMIEAIFPGMRVFNSIYFTLQPGEGWPKTSLKTPSLNYPGGIE